MHLERFYSASVLILSRPGAEDSRTVSEPGTERERLSSTSVNEPVSRGFLTLQNRMLFVLTMTAFWFHHANLLRGQCTASGQASDGNSPSCPGPFLFIQPKGLTLPASRVCSGVSDRVYINACQVFIRKQHSNLSQVGTSRVVQWLGLGASTAGGMGLIPGWGTKIPYTMRHSQKKRKKKSM